MAWRLCKRDHADLSGTGARLHGGRWNSPGRALVYTAATAELAVLEVRVHLDVPPEMIPNDFVLMEIDLTGLDVEAVAAFPADPTAFGDTWLAEARTPVLCVPSAIVPEASNLLFNPAHPQAGAARVVGVRAFQFDRRLWRPL
ncbi:RES family NAD+ phosphorylase [Roseospira visakhapatnamensis]|uniref:RES domain-containing protein n=1 Tax=Roseospira visakhapatnamensis TaxID=390880 RepID=A0A7W6WB68_9PROT|nr:RES family NAD+ phosphorylase [Roseospira visakhapatnamensis]MBB4268010.1 RES domain-containing protein [Roseospira visakhapatnamensis]